MTEPQRGTLATWIMIVTCLAIYAVAVHFRP